jgi:regulator of PEP synthase PpsR (kinase-PPPase family)
MNGNEDKLVEIMSLMLDEMRDMKREQQTTNKRLERLEEQQIVANQRLEAIEYALTHDGREFRNRIERLESRVTKIEEQT